MPDARMDQTWGTSQLVEFLAVLSGQPMQANANQAAVERVIEALDAEIGVLLDGDGSPIVVVGLAEKDPRVKEIIAVPHGRLHVDGLGPCRTASVALAPGRQSSRLLVARLGDEDFLPIDLLLLRGMAWVLDLTRKQLQMLTQLNERQRVLERLARVQRDIAARAPLPEVFQAVTESALSLVGSEYALLHLFDRAGPATVSVSGIDGSTRGAPRLVSLSAAVAAEVQRHGRPVRRADLRLTPDRAAEPAISTVPADRRAGLGAPVRGEHGEVAGSLVVISPADGVPFGESQEQALVTFADQVSVALADARSQLAAQHALRDPVTGLPNRVGFLDRLESALARGAQVHVMFIDLDRFKDVNDRLGHAVGDELLRKVGRRLRAALRSDERLARFGGDEFAALVENATDEGVRSAAERLLTAVAAPYQIGAERVSIDCSIGVAVATPGSSAADVLRNADTAMYRAKRAGGGRLVTFDPLVHTVSRHHGAVADLRRAVATDALRVVYQPILGLRDGALHAVEALVRWDHPTRGELSPDEFIPLAEQTGLIVPLGRAVLATACAQAAAWAEVVQDGRGPCVSVNISPRQLHEPSLLDDVRAVLADVRLDPDRLLLEIEESTLAADPDSARDLLSRLRELGVRLAVDDAGASRGDADTLRTLPVEWFKLDRALLDAVTDPWHGRGVVQATIRLAHSLSMTPVAVGVEDEAQVQALLELGCEVGQGFGLAHPLSAADVVGFAGERQPARPALTYDREWGNDAART